MSSTFQKRLQDAVQNLFPFEDSEEFESWVSRARLENHGRRSLIAATMVNVGKRIRAEEADDKRLWIATARVAFEPRSREPCFVCGKFRSITQAHHVIPLGEQFDRHFTTPDHEHEFLCPNHHVMLHLWIDDRISERRRGQRAAPTIGDMTNEEINRVLALVRRASSNPLNYPAAP